MSDRVHWEVIPPAEPCTSPDGHSPVDHMIFGSYVPAAVRCTRCGRSFQVVVFEEEDV